MNDDPNNHHRRSTRLRGYDYTQSGVYFVTICTQARAHRFGRVNDGAIDQSPAGQLLNRCWQALPWHFSFVTTDTYVILPDHIHGILMIDHPGDLGRPLSTRMATARSRCTNLPSRSPTRWPLRKIQMVTFKTTGTFDPDLVIATARPRPDQRIGTHVAVSEEGIWYRVAGRYGAVPLI